MPQSGRPDRRMVLAGAGLTALAGGGALASGDPAPVLPGSRGDRIVAGRVREYWLQAEPYEADAVPSGRDGFRDVAITGSGRYVGLRYRAFRPNWSAPLPASLDIGANAGVPGPILRAEVGDEIVVHFRNADDHYRQPHSLHAHGLDYDQAHDGVWSAARPGAPGAAVPISGEHTYRWRAAASSVGVWPYHDNSRPFRPDRPGDPALGADEWIGKHLGLVGFIVVSEPKTPRPDREFFLVVHDLAGRDMPGLTMPGCGALNGRAYLGNTPEFTARVGERVRWCVLGPNGIGAPRVVSFPHEFHVGGHRWRWRGRSQASTVILPDDVAVLEWTEDNPGRWLYRSHSIRDVSMYGWYVVA